MVLKLLWVDAPTWFMALIYALLGWVAVAAFPGLIVARGFTATAMVAAGGAALHGGSRGVRPRGARTRPPTVFGYHEVFHALVILAAGLQYAVIAFWVLPGRRIDPRRGANHRPLSP